MPATSLAAGTNPPPTGETLNGDNTVPGPFSSAITCQSVTAGTLSYTISGLALGPYPGTFTESGTVAISGGVVTSFSATFTVTSGTTTLNGTATGVTSTANGQCIENQPDFPLGTNFFETAGFGSTYQVSVTGPTGTNVLTGPISSTFNFTSGAFSSGGSQQVMGTAVELPPTPPVCQPGGDEDHDGLIDSRENLYLALSTDPDTDHDGIRDGNDDANHNGVSDEDEDDHGNVCDEDSDHNHISDEDEDEDD